MLVCFNHRNVKLKYKRNYQSQKYENVKEVNLKIYKIVEFYRITKFDPEQTLWEQVSDFAPHYFTSGQKGVKGGEKLNGTS